MNESSPPDFRITALETRYLLLLAITHIRKKSHFGASEIAMEITTNAINNHLIEPRKPPTGAMLQRWIKNKNPPAWAIKSATLLLKDSMTFNPTENEKIPFSFTLAELYPDKSIDEIFEKIPSNLKPNISLDMLEKAKRAIGEKKVSDGNGTL